MSGFGLFFWIVALAIWIGSGYYKAKKRREARLRKAQQMPQPPLREPEEQPVDEAVLDEFLEGTDFAEFLKAHDPTAFAEAETAFGREPHYQQPAPEEEGSFRTRYQEAEAEGVSAIPQQKPQPKTERRRHEPQMPPMRLPDGQVFDLRTAMIYDVILHRRTTGFFAPRTPYRTLR